MACRSRGGGPAQSGGYNGFGGDAQPGRFIRQLWWGRRPSRRCLWGVQERRQRETLVGVVEVVAAEAVGRLAKPKILALVRMLSVTADLTVTAVSSCLNIMTNCSLVT